MNEPPSQSEREIAELLAELRVDPPSGGFEQSLAKRLAQAAADFESIDPPVRLKWRARLRALFAHRPVLLGSCSGALAGAAVFGLMYGVVGLPSSQPVVPAAGHVFAEAHTGGMDTRQLPVSPASYGAQPEGCLPGGGTVASAEVFLVPRGKVAMVQLQFDVDASVPAAEFSVLLPPGLSFFNEGQALPEKVFRWVAPLEQGANRVPVAVVGEVPGEHRLTALATVGSRVVVHEIVLQVEGAV